MNPCLSDKLPRLEVSLDKIGHNARILVEMCHAHHIGVMGVTKSVCAIADIARAMADSGIDYLADSRVSNLVKLQDIALPKVLLRLPMFSELEKVVRYADISLNSELETIHLLGREALKQKKRHRVILMIDLGDLREGIWPDQLENTVAQILNQKGVVLEGLGVNLSCYGGVMPNETNLTQLSQYAQFVEERFQIHLNIVSGGNSSSLPMLNKGEIPGKINNLRIGEAILLGREPARGGMFRNARPDAFKLVAQVVEIQKKPSIPIGKIGMDAFGKVPVFSNSGIRKRAILAIGRQDVSPEMLLPLDDDINILGGSSDYILVDITQAKSYAVGDTIEFSVNYASLLQLMTSPYVHKVIQ